MTFAGMPISPAEQAAHEVLAERARAAGDQNPAIFEGFMHDLVHVVVWRRIRAQRRRSAPATAGSWYPRRPRTGRR